MFNNIPREKLTGQFNWQPAEEQYTEYKWNPEKKKMAHMPATREVLKIYPVEPAAKQERALSGLKKFFGRFTGKACPVPTADVQSEPLIYEFEKIHAQFFIISENDTERLLYVFANNPEPLLAQITRDALKHVAFYSESDKKIVINALKALHHLWKAGMGEMAHVFVASCMVTNDKTTAALAAGVWASGVKNNNVNSILIGQVIGKLLHGELAPLKRFTDLLEDYMLGISAAHNTALLQLLTALAAELPDTPLKNVKKLMELYLKMLALANQTVSDSRLAAKLATWKGTSSLAKIITSIENRV